MGDYWTLPHMPNYRHIPPDHGVQAVMLHSILAGTAQNSLLSFVTEPITAGGPINKIFQTSKCDLHYSRGYITSNNRLLVVS
jgi:hypothetical protein